MIVMTRRKLCTLLCTAAFAAMTKAPRPEAMHIKNARLFNFAAGKMVLAEWERQHIHECDVCQHVAYVFIRQSVASPI